MIRHRLLGAACVALLAFGCTKRPGPASPDFQKARQAYLDLLAKDGPGDVYTDPELPDLRAELDKVPADSVDSDAARSLASTIDKGIADAKAAATEREKVIKETTEVASAPALPAADEGSPTGAPAGTPDAGKAAASGPSEGETAADFMLHYSSCFEKQGAFTDDKGHTGDTWALSDSCASKYPAFKDQLVMVGADKVVAVVPRSSATSTKIAIGQQQAQKAQQPVAQAQQPAQAPAPVNPNTIDQQVKTPESQVQVPQNLNSDLDAREKMPGQP